MKTTHLAILNHLKAELYDFLLSMENELFHENLRLTIDRFIREVTAILSLDTVMIKGSEVPFSVLVDRDNLPYRAQHIWDNPSQYSNYEDGSEDAYYKFLKFLWVIFPDGRQVQLAEYVNHGVKNEN